MIVYLSVDQVIAMHASLVADFGGSSGVRDRRGVESTVARPAMTFGGEDLYSDVAAKAAALMHSLALNHPFMDGNTRVAVHAAELFMQINGTTLEADDAELIELTVRAAEGRLAVEALGIWFRQHAASAE